ncbi:MAG TPA: hypothetical protein VFB14_24430 [Bryobacteraceae bacterium]|nr:hypothetical protein [Bryobacteraceae bacterium]
MKTAAITMMMLLANAAARPQAIPNLDERKVAVCLERGAIDPGKAWVARTIASEIFAKIGVTVVWNDPHDCPATAIFISISQKTPATLKPGALAYALPYEGVHIRVFYDRIAQSSPLDNVPVVLGYVLVHEMTHILEGISRHSESGVMKAHWDKTDFFAMRRNSLRFAEEDIRLIFVGLEGRSHASILALNRKPVAVAAR